MKKIFALAAALCAAATLSCREGEEKNVPYVTGEKDVEVAESLMKRMPGKGESMQGNMIFAAKELLGTEYVASTLEEGDREKLRVYLTKTDCILFVETCFNLARTVRDGKNDFQSLANRIFETRYRGKCELYSDRVHYTTEWIRRNEKAGRVKDLTLELGGIAVDKPINYMSTHARSYKHLSAALKEDAPAEERALAKENLETIGSVEKELSEQPQTWIPSEKIKEIEDRICSGDIIGFMTTVSGLDIGHVAIAYVHDGKVGFIHASQGGGLVMEQPESIADYVLHVRKNCQGIKVVRPL